MRFEKLKIKIFKKIIKKTLKKCIFCIVYISKYYFKVSGWGAVHENKTGESSMLQLVYVTTSPCVNTEFITYNTANHFCAGSPANNTGPLIGICTTDVGGPLVLNNLLIGIPFHHDPRACGRFLVSL